MTHPKIPKYRPYFTYSEMGCLINAITKLEIESAKDLDSTDKKHLQNIKRTLQRTIALAELDLNKPAYTTNPRTTLNDRLGFADTESDPPDFSELMDKIVPSNPNI